ncbi:MAG: hypothetical protein EBY39_03125 [Flavobacteriia bacterium]|nr:hypothetical protein [Flavobacteriia bacterium]
MQKTKNTRYIYTMKVLKPTTDEQTFYIIPRLYFVNDEIEFRDDQTNEVVKYTPTIVKENDFLKITGVFNLREGHFYDVALKLDYDLWQEANVKWELSAETWDEPNKAFDYYSVEKVFCTAQTIDQNMHKEYSINKGVYKTDDSFDNDYIVL